LKDVVPATAACFGRAIIMPNLVPPVTTTDAALAYRERILAQAGDTGFQPLMTLYLTETTTPETIREAKAAGVVAAKLYPAGATTNSDSGVKDIRNIYPVLEAMAECGMLLLVHGEVTDADIDIFDREKVFLDRVLAPTMAAFPNLKVVLEHITTADSAEFVQQHSGDNLAATLTPQHLMYNRNHMLVGGIRPHLYCLPILKRNRHQQALRDAVASGDNRFFLGTDSAPHAKDRKEAACGCAGCYSAYGAIGLYADIFEELGILDKLEAFASFNGADFYGLPRHTDTITLVRDPWTMPEQLPLAGGHIVPLKAGETVNWRLA
ncbi:MAG: dihydroorotase, partial [Oleiphilaceae bacterium]|nr:dihydroorotase [Oleiphilaceae bacterium]